MFKDKSKLILNRGFDEKENKEYGQILGYCSKMDTVNNIEYQNRLFKMIENIIHNSKLDYISKLEKIQILIELNFSLNEYQKEIYEQCS